MPLSAPASAAPAAAVTPADADDSEALVAAVQESVATRAPLAIAGHGSKHFLGVADAAKTLSTRGHAGIIDYRPSELVVTARAGTPLATLVRVLAAEGQMLPFDPPRFGGLGTLGGAIAAGLAGPSRPWLGGVRDAVLGVEIVNGLGERLRFGGSVIKNVAGYDVSRLMAGARGTLGVILSASLRVVPKPATERTLAVDCTVTEAGRHTAEWLRQPLPITATCFVGGTLRVRLAGHAAAVEDAANALAAGPDAVTGDFWASVRDHAHDFFAGDGRLDRLWLPRGAGCEHADALVEWSGGQAWLRRPAEAIAGAFVQPFRAPAEALADAPAQAPAVEKYQRRVKAAFDPHGLLNPGLAPSPP